MEILTLTEQNKLVAQTKLKDLETNDYLNDITNDNFKIISDLYFNKDNNRCKSFNVWTNLFATITDVISNFVWNPTLTIDFNITKYVRDLISVWKLTVWLKRVDNWTTNWRFELYHIPAENHLISDWENKVFTMYKTIEKDEVIYYLLKQTFKVWTIENQLFKLAKYVDNEWQEVPLDTIAETSNLQPIIRTWLDRPSIFTIQINELNGIQSELDRIKNLVYSLDRKAVMFETQFLWEIEQFKIFENIYIPEVARNSDWTVSMAKLPKILATDTTLWASGDIKYISNENKLITQAIEYEQTQIRKISSATWIPVDFLWLQDTTAISWTSRELMMSAFIKKIQWYRDLINDLLEEILTIMEWTLNKNGEEITKEILRADITETDSKELVEELKIARESGLISRFTWIKKYLHYNTEDLINEELDLINQENLALNPINNGNESED